jgi:hypothetical protein
VYNKTRSDDPIEFGEREEHVSICGGRGYTSAICESALYNKLKNLELLGLK